MAGKHAKQAAKRRGFVIWLIVLAVLVLAAAGVWAWQSGLFAAPSDTAATDSTTHAATATTSSPTTETTSTAPTTAPVPDETPPDEDTPITFARPDEMRGVWLTAGVDYATDGQSDADCKAAIDTALATLAEWEWNTVILPLSERQITATAGFDAPAYILERARERGLYVYMVLDCGVMTEDGRDPTLLGDRLRVTFLARRMAERWAADGFLLTGYAYRYGDLPEMRARAESSIHGMLTDAIAQIKAVNKNYYVGLLAEAVWAHASVKEGGSDTANVYEEFTDGAADTKAFIESGSVDFVMVKNFRSTGDYSASFTTVLNWWGEVCQAADKPLYIAHAATRVAGEQSGWKTEDQLARQVLACQGADAWQGSSFDSMAALTAHKASTAAVCHAFDGTLQEEYISRTLTLTEPASERVTTNESTFILRGSADPNFPLTLNGEEIALTEHGYFTLDVTLSPGDNTFVFENKGVKTTYVINYTIIILKSVSPAEPLTMDGGSAITVSALAHRDATVYATIGGERVTMTATKVQENEGQVESADYVTYTAAYTLPAGLQGQARELGAVTVTGTYRSQTQTMSGGTITVNALPIDEETRVEVVPLPDLEPIDPAKGGEVLANGTVMIITADYAETFNGNTTDDYSRPTNAYLPLGTTDLLKGTAYDAASDRHYYLLGCGRRVYVEDAKTYITAGTISANSLITSGVSVTADGTAVTLGADWRVPFQLQLLPQVYGNPAKQDYSSTGQTTEYIEITFSYTTAVSGTPDMTNSPLFSRAEWTKGEGNTYVLRLYLTKTAQFYGYHVGWNNEGQITFTFRHPTYVGDNSAEQPLSGFTVVLDPGHGGDSVGTSGGKVSEKTLVLTYSLLMRDKLESLGAKVIMTRTDDTDPTMLERSQITRASGADLFISVHMNGFSSSSVRGCTVHYFSDYSREVAKGMYEQIQGVYTSFGCERRGGFPWSPFFVCRVSEMPALLVECGYMTNAADLELLVTPAFQDAFATAVTKAVLEYAQSLPKL